MPRARITTRFATGLILLAAVAGFALFASGCDDEEEPTVAERTLGGGLSTIPTIDATADAQHGAEVRQRLNETLDGEVAGAIDEIRVISRKMDITVNLTMEQIEAGQRICDAALEASDQATSIIVWRVDGGALARCQRPAEG